MIKAWIYYWLGHFCYEFGSYLDQKLFSLHSKTTDWFAEKYQDYMDKSVKLDKNEKIWKKVEKDIVN